VPQGAKSAIVGTTPEGAQDERAAAATVRAMFSAIAPRYDLLNHVLSLNVDRWWWRRTARTFAHVLARPQTRVLDLCCGTGDMALALRRRAGSAHPAILAVDFSHPMLRLAHSKFAGKDVTALEADALQLPFATGRFDLVVTSFGFRNLANYAAGLREIHRVLAEGGEIGILDFHEPRGLLGALYGFYLRRVLPRIGTLISGVRGPYQYLPASVAKFPAPQDMLARMRAAGFGDVSWTPYSFGIAGLFRGTKQAR
jgi:demethylmenaquinone methyltransferase/2-methoxy-6-polyprenyl-1,4-benzoquinol methylase